MSVKKLFGTDGVRGQAGDYPLDHSTVARLGAALRALPLLEREALSLFHLEGLSLRQVAEVTAVPEGTVKSRLHRARRLLRRTIEKKETRP